MAAKAALISYARPTTLCQIIPAPAQTVKEPPPFHNQTPTFSHQFSQDRAAQAAATLSRSGTVDIKRREHVAFGTDIYQQDPAPMDFASTSRASLAPDGASLLKDLWETESPESSDCPTSTSQPPDFLPASRIQGRPHWQPVQPLHQEPAESCMRNASLRTFLSPSWRIMLLSDGSVTRHLQALSNTKTQTKCFEMLDIGHAMEGLPSGVELIEGPRIQRQVFLENGHGDRLVYAASWWAASDVDTYLSDVQAPIWTNLMAAKAPLHRSIACVYLGHSATLEREFGMPGPFWARHYTFYVKGRPLTLIYEVFSNALEAYLGPSGAFPQN